MADSYQKFAEVYDELMDNIPYDKWASYLHDLLIENNTKNGIICELGCGTGNITERLARFGYDMIGVDNSIEMLDLANIKKNKNNSSSLYLCQDMREFELYGTVDAVVSVCDSINYITDTNDLIQVFKLVNNYLDPKGVFIFDFNTDYYYGEIVADSTIAEDRDDISFIWDNYYDESTSINELALSLFIKEKDELYRKYEELHIQRGYTLKEIKDALTASGLVFLNAYDAFSKNTVSNSSERIYVIAREQGK